MTPRTILLIAALWSITTPFLSAQCPNITDVLVFNSVQSGDDCTFDMEIGTDVTSNTANHSIKVIVSLNNTEVVNKCLPGLHGSSSSKIIKNITILCATDLEDLEITYQGYNGNGGCARGNSNGNNNSGPCHTEPETFAGVIQGALPVELIAFQANPERFQQVQLEWVTAMERNNALFLVEHSSDGRNFNEIASVRGQGTSNLENYYTFIHKFPEAGINYYRLKQVDYNGIFSYSEVISIVVDKNRMKPFVIANSLAESEITLLFNGKLSENAKVEIFNASGTLFYQSKLDAEASYHNISIGSLEPGIYYVRLPIDKEYRVERFVKVRQ